MRTFIWLLLVGLLFDISRAADWPQYRGPQRNDISAETGLLAAWPSGGPKLLWTYTNAGVGYSGPAIVGDRLYTIGARDESEFLIALNLKTIENQAVTEVWATEIGPKFDFSGNHWSAGPSSTPTVDGDLIYTLGGKGDLLCVEAATGKTRWKKNLPDELDAQVNPIGGGPKALGWGFTWSPLVDGNQLVCIPGGPKGTVAALNKKTGEVLWRSSGVTDQAAYTSPMPSEIGGVRQYVVLTNRGLIGVAANDGRLLWKYERPYSTEVVNSPLIQGDLVYATVGAGQGCDLIRVTSDGAAFKTETIYANKNMANHHGDVVLVDGHVYGHSDGRGWVCQDFTSGEVKWMERQKFRAGAVTFADGHLYCYSEEDGTTALLEANPTGWKETGRFTIPQKSELRKPRGKIWTPPVVSGGKLYLRDQELLFCFEITAEK